MRKTLFNKKGEGLVTLLVVLIVIALVGIVAVTGYYFIGKNSSDGNSEGNFEEVINNSLDEPQADCIEIWDCEDWSDCLSGEQTRTCSEESECGSEVDKPIESRFCNNVQEVSNQDYLDDAWEVLQEIRLAVSNQDEESMNLLYYNFNLDSCTVSLSENECWSSAKGYFEEMAFEKNDYYLSKFDERQLILFFETNQENYRVYFLRNGDRLIFVSFDLGQTHDPIDIDSDGDGYWNLIEIVSDTDAASETSYPSFSS